MKRQVLIFGIVGGILIALLKWTEYRFLVLENSLEIYGGLIAITFAVIGIWLGLRIRNARHPAPEKDAPPAGMEFAPATPATSFVLDERKRDYLGITRRELEILELIAQGLSNREIAGKLFVSENTVKTHCSRAFDKLGARRRTEAVQMGKKLGLIP
jgi:DNA-binding CsgD family transcriptional regulator